MGTFAGQVAGGTVRHARLMSLCRTMPESVGLVPAGRAGSRLAARLGLVTGRTAMLGLVHALPDPEAGTVAVLGVDDSALAYRKNPGQAGRSDDIGPFIDFFARAVVDTCRAEIRLIDEVTFTRECLTNALPPDPPAALRHVMASMTALPVINNQRIAERYRLTAKSAATITDALASQGILLRLDDTGKPGQAYSCPSVLDLFVRHGQRNNSVHYGPISTISTAPESVTPHDQQT